MKPERRYRLRKPFEFLRAGLDLLPTHNGQRYFVQVDDDEALSSQIGNPTMYIPAAVVENQPEIFELIEGDPPISLERQLYDALTLVSEPECLLERTPGGYCMIRVSNDDYAEIQAAVTRARLKF
jgi:hypothetical protein